MKSCIKLWILLLVNLTSSFCQTSISLSFDHLALSVKDVHVSAEFYKNILNLQEITNRTQMDGIKWFSLGDGKELHMISTIKEPVIINKAVHFAMKTKQFDAFILTLKEKKIPYSDWPGNINTINKRPDGIQQVFFQDPNGYWIEVNSVH